MVPSRLVRPDLRGMTLVADEVREAFAGKRVVRYRVIPEETAPEG